MSQIRRTPADEPFYLVRTLGARVAAGTRIGRHAHGWGQLIYCASGVMSVWTEDGSWVAPASWAIWAPAGVRHEIRFAGEALLRTLYLRRDAARGLPDGCAVLAVSPLLRELIVRAVELGMLDERVPSQAMMASLIVAEAAVRDAPPFQLPLPADPLLRRAADILAAGGARSGAGRAGLGIAAAAAELGLGSRTLERRFRQEAGMSLGAWGRQARLLLGVQVLAEGGAVKDAAAAAGYRTPSAFVAAFRSAFGETPARYFTELSPGRSPAEPPRGRSPGYSPTR